MKILDSHKQFHKARLLEALKEGEETVSRQALQYAVDGISALEETLIELEAYATELEQQHDKELQEKEKRYERLEKNLIRLQTDLVNRQQREQENYEEIQKLETRARQRESEQRAIASALETERHNFNVERSEAIEQLNMQTQEFEEEKARYTRESKKKLEENTSAFVEEILTSLNKKEIKLSRISFWSALFGGLILITGLVSLVYLSFRSDILALGNMSWPQIVYFATKGAVIAGVIGVISRYSYVFSSEYQRESLRVADKSHAIKFGQLYVETYGAAADWDRVKDAFSNWHGAAESTESNSDKGQTIEPAESPKQITEALGLVKDLKSILK